MRIRHLFWAFLGLALGLIAGYLWTREPSESLTRARLEEAQVRWQENVPASYLLELESKGAVNAHYRIVVRDGEVVEMTTSGREAARSAWEYWSVNGLFRFLETELQNAAEPGKVYGPAAAEVVLRARFDSKWGYPAYFLRHVLGTRQSIEWKVKNFQPQDP